MQSIFSSLLLLSLSLPLLVVGDCSCYATDNGGVYSKAAMWDFRQQTVGAIPDPSSTRGKYGQTQEGYLTSNEFTQFWRIQQWNEDANPDIPRPDNIQRDPANVYLDINTDSTTGAASKLVLRAKQFADFNSGAELNWANDLQGQFHFGSFRVRAKVTGDEGACAGFFTYLDDTKETDIEILTKDPVTHVHYTNQPGNINGEPVPDATTDFDISTIGITKKRSYPPLLRSRQAGQGWNGWRTWRFDWLDGLTTFYIDGAKAIDKTVQVPTVDMNFVLNMWSDGGSWSGDMATNAAAQYEIEWIEFFYEPTDATGCCSVDDDANSVQNGYAL